MAGVTWFDILSYSWFLMFKALGTNKDPLKGKVREGLRFQNCLKVLL